MTRGVSRMHRVNFGDTWAAAFVATHRSCVRGIRIGSDIAGDIKVVSLMVAGVETLVGQLEAELLNAMFEAPKSLRPVLPALGPGQEVVVSVLSESHEPLTVAVSVLFEEVPNG